ncbi:hypothetical protein GGI21_000619 [Coemansia aciculifera]|nr:hypothetical protein GGI21_000619 [Coemansia aciculifera]
MLRRHRIFTPTSHPKLLYVSVTNYDEGAEDRVFATAIEFLHFALNIAPGASARVINGLPDLAECLGLLDNYADIQVLSFPETDLSIWDVMSLLELLPLLSGLESYAMLGTLPQGITTAGLPDYVRSIYTVPIGKRFRRRTIGHFTACGDTEVATCVLLLALVCPSFNAVGGYCFHSDMFFDELEEQIYGPAFQQDASRLRRLLPAYSQGDF